MNRIAGRIIIALLVVLALLIAGCGATPTPPPTPAPTQAPPTPTQPAASEVPVSAAGDVLGVWQVEDAAEGPLLFIFAEFTGVGQNFSAYSGSQGFDHGLFTVKENQLAFVTDVKTCYLCKGSYAVYVTSQDGRPARLRFAVNGQDANAARASALNGKTATLLTGALPGEVPVSTIEDVNGDWQAIGDPRSTRLTCANGQCSSYPDNDASGAVGGSVVVKDGKLMYHTPVFGDGSYLVFVKRQSGQPVWLRFVSTGDEKNTDREEDLHGKIWLPVSKP
jgi:hypothetical protein